MPSSILSNQVLVSEDLDLLQTFLEAWCAENAVDIHEDAAREVAIGLIDWYQFGLTDRSELRAIVEDISPLPPALQSLFERLPDVKE